MITIISDTYLEGFDDKNFFYVEKALKSCTGCFSCWTKSPGLCIFKDTFNKKIINSDKLVIISKNTYGTYSSKIKSVIDKSIPLVLPTFKVINNETHHRKRYNQYPNIHSLVYDSINEDMIKTYKAMVEAHGINLHADKVQVDAVNKSDLKQALTMIIGGHNV